MPEETVGAADTVTCDCEPCKRKHGHEHNVRSGVIHSYSSMPRGGWRKRYAARTEGDDSAPTFGIELETSAPFHRVTDLPNRPATPYLPFGASDADIAEHASLMVERENWRRRNTAHRARQERRWVEAGNITADEAVSLSAPRGFWHAKHDGSVSGPEFCSQPATLAYWRSQRPQLTAMFRALLHGGMRSHDGDTCGLHVNIGSDAFTDGDHLRRLAALLHANPRWSTRMSMRTHNSARQWASFDVLRDEGTQAAWAAQWERFGYTTVHRYAVLNCSNAGRVEFRLPRGTLRVDRFYSQLEWTAAMVEYTRNPSNATNPSAFTRWVRAQGDAYPFLLAYMQERFAGRFAEQVERPAREPVADVVPEGDGVPFCQPCDDFGERSDHSPTVPGPHGEAARLARLGPGGARCGQYGIGGAAGFPCDRSVGHTTDHRSIDAGHSWRMDTEEDRHAARFEFTGITDVVHTQMCTCGERWGRHTGILCPANSRTWSPRS